MMDLHDAAANALRTAWLNGKANTTEGWALHVEAARLVDFIREQIAREIEARMERDDAQGSADFSEGLWSGLNEAKHMVARGES